MKLRIRYFAQAREAAGADEEEVELSGGGTVSALWKVLVSRHGGLRAVEDGVSLLVGSLRAGPAEELREGQVVSVIPPVSGG